MPVTSNGSYDPIAVDRSHVLARGLRNMVVCNRFGAYDLITKQRGTITGTITSHRDNGGALYHRTGNGGTYYETLPIAAITTATHPNGVSFGYRVRVNTNNSSQTIVNATSVAGYQGRFFFGTAYQETMRFWLHNDNYTIVRDMSPANFVIGAWTTVVFTISALTSGSTITAYVDGKVVATDTLLADFVGTIDLLQIGGSSSCDISHVGIWSRCMTNTEAVMWSKGDFPLQFAQPITQRIYSPTAASGSYTLTSSYGSYVLGSIAAATKAGRLLTAAQQTYTETGIAATLRLGKLLAAAVGGFTETGTATAFRLGRRLTAAVGTFSETGVVTNLKAGRKVVASAVSFTLDGKNVIFIYSPAGSHSLIAGTGSYTTTTIAASLLKQLKIAAATGAFTEVGINANLNRGRRLTATTQAFSFSPSSTIFQVLRRLVANATSYNLTGKVISLNWSGAPIIDTDDSEYIFGQSGDAISILITDLMPHDDASSSLSTSLGG